MSIFCGVRDQFIYKKGGWYRLIERDFDSPFDSDMESAVRQGFGKASADVFQVGTEINLFEHLSLVKSLMSPGDGRDPTGSFVKMRFDFIAHS